MQHVSQDICLKVIRIHLNAQKAAGHHIQNVSVSNFYDTLQIFFFNSVPNLKELIMYLVVYIYITGILIVGLLL